jgi:hypothetical protein
VHWLNRLGGYDAFNFYMKSIHTTDIKKDTFDQQHHDWTGNTYSYDKQSRGTTEYNVALNKKVTVNTDYLSEDGKPLAGRFGNISKRLHRGR